MGRDTRGPQACPHVRSNPLVTASEVMMVAIGSALVGRWANNKSTPLGPKQVIEAVFAVLFVGFLDQGKTEPIAKGFAWLFLAAVLLSPTSPLNALSKAENAKTKTTTKPKVVTVLWLVALAKSSRGFTWESVFSWH